MPDRAARLNGLSCDVERDVGGVDHTLHEAQILRQQVLVPLLDHNLARVEPQPVVRPKLRHTLVSRPGYV